MEFNKQLFSNLTFDFPYDIDEYIKNPISELEYSILRAGIDDLSGHCNNCKEFFDVEAVDNKGVCFRKIDQKYFNV